MSAVKSWRTFANFGRDSGLVSGLPVQPGL